MTRQPGKNSAQDTSGNRPFQLLAFDAYLFDIDGTLLNSRDGVHYHAFLSALRTAYGCELKIDGVPVHGNTDIGILRAVTRQAGIDDAKASKTIKTIRDFETFLRDAGGFSIAAAKAIASGGFKANPTPRDEGGTAKELASLRDRAASVFSP